MQRLISPHGQHGEIPRLVSALRAKGSRVAYVGYLRSPGFDTPVDYCKRVGNELEARIARMAERDPGVLYLQSGALVPHGDKSFHSWDLIHPSAKGSQSIGNALAHRLGSVSLQAVGRISAANHALLAVGLILGLTGLAAGAPALVIPLCFYFVVMGAVEVLLETGLQNEIEVSARATITSVTGAGLEIWVTALFLIVGTLAVRSDWSTALSVVAVGAVLLSLLLSSIRIAR